MPPVMVKNDQVTFHSNALQKPHRLSESHSGTLKKLPQSFPHRQDRNGRADMRGVRQCFLNYCLGTGLGQQNLYYPSQAVHPSVLGHVSPHSVFANQTRLFQVPEETCRTGKPAANTHSESQTCNSQKVLSCSYHYQKNLLS